MESTPVQSGYLKSFQCLSRKGMPMTQFAIQESSFVRSPTNRSWNALLAFLLLLMVSTPHAQELSLESRVDYERRMSFESAPVAVSDSYQTSAHEGPHIRLSEANPIQSSSTHRLPPNLRLNSRVGVHRPMPAQYMGDITPDLKWQETVDGRILSTLYLTSPGAASLRLNIRTVAPAGTQLHYFQRTTNGANRRVHSQSVHPSRVQSNQSVSLWSPTLHSEQVGLEILLPNRQSLSSFSFEIQRVSHVTDSSLENIILPMATSSSCDNQIDAPCGTDPDALGKVAAVGRILVEKDGEPVFCSGTLINSKDATSDPLALGDGPAPYLLTSNSCVATQEEADSIEVTWFLQQSFCGASTSDHRAATTFGGSNLLATSVDQDATLLRLRGDPPGGLVYSGWRASRLAVPTDGHAIHHPRGDMKKISSGSAMSHVSQGRLVDAIRVDWQSGAAESGSEGAGLFVDGYLVGTLSQSNNVCKMGTSHFGAFEKFYPKIKGYLQGDHGDDAQNATTIGVPVSLEESLTAGDNDYFQIVMSAAGRLEVLSEGGTDTVATLRVNGRNIVEDDNSGLDNNFLIRRDLQPGNYILWVRGRSESTTGKYRLRTSIDLGSAPTSSPSNVVVARGAGQLELSWDLVSAADNGGSVITGYLALATNAQGQGGSCTTLARDTSCVIEGLTPGSEYTIRVRARNAVGDGPDSASVTAVPLESEGTRIVAAPANVRTDIDQTDGSLTVHWDKISEDDGAINVLRYTVEAVSNNETLSCEADADTVTCTLTGFDDAVTYSLTVYAESSVGAGPKSEPIHVTPVHSADHGDARTTAFSIGLNSDTAAYLSENDEDYFLIEVEERGTLWAWTEETTDTSGYLLSDTADIARDWSSGQGGNFRFSAVLDPGTYYIRVVGGVGPYTLSTSFIVDDHGDGRSSATDIEPNSSTGGYLAAGDEDFFRVEISARGTLRVETTGTTDTSGFLLSDTADIARDWSSSGQGDNFRFSAVLDPGTYYIRVVGGVGPYTLSTSFIVDDHGDGRSSATDIEPNSSTGGYLAAGDEDFFRVEISARGTLRVETTGTTRTVGYLLSDTADITSDGDRRYGYDNSGQGDNFRFSAVLDPGTYYIRVLGGIGPYTLISSISGGSEASAAMFRQSVSIRESEQ